MRPLYESDDMVYPEDKPDAHEILVGRSQRQRATKTNIKDEQGATLLNIISAASLRWAKTIQQLRLRRTGELLPLERVLEDYAGINGWMRFHHGELEHLGSVKGFLPQLMVRSYDITSKAAPRESSHEPGSNGNGAMPKYDE